MTDPLDDLKADLKALLVEAETAAVERSNEWNAARARAAIAKEASADADATLRRLSRALDLLERPAHTRVGRPRGGRPDGTRERVRTLLANGSTWRPAELQAALAEQGHAVGPSAVTAALAALARDGAAVRVARGEWKAIA